MTRPGLTIVTPLPPQRSGVATYALRIGRALARHYDLTFVVDQPDVDLQGLEARILRWRHVDKDALRARLCLHQLANNADHAHVYEAARTVPGLVVQHDMSVHHLVREMSFDQPDRYRDAVTAEFGDRGAALDKAFRTGFLDDRSLFLFSLLRHVLQDAWGTIVHSEWAAARMRRIAPGTVSVIPHFIEDALIDRSAQERRVEEEARALYDRLGITGDRFVIGCLGFATEPKRIVEIAGAVRAAAHAHPQLHLLVGGEARSPAVIAALEPLREAGLATVTGYLPDDEMERLAARVDLLFSLRFPSVGESSGVLSTGMGLGLPCVVFEDGPIAEMAGDAAFRLPLRGLGETLVRDIEVLLRAVMKLPPAQLQAMGARGRARAKAVHHLDRVADLYRDAIERTRSAQMATS